jgi:hypothetical protein
MRAMMMIALMMEAVRMSETSVYYNEATRRNNAEGSVWIHLVQDRNRWQAFVNALMNCRVA